jgi:hypothetical protein
MKENKYLTRIEDPDRDDEDNTNLFIDEISASYNIGELMKTFIKFEKGEFKITYQIFINDLRKQNDEFQYKTCRMFLKLISETIEFEFDKNPKLETQKDFDSVYEFALFLNSEFVEYIHLFYIDQYLTKVHDPEKGNLVYIDKKDLSSTNIENGVNLIIDLLDGENDSLKIKFLKYCDKKILEVLIKLHITNDYSKVLLNLMMYFNGREVTVNEHSND